MASSPRVLTMLVLLAFAARIGLRLAQGASSFLDHGYGFYLLIARTLISGGGFCTSPGAGCVSRMPAYPLLLAPFASTGWLYPGIPLIQAAIGASMVWMAWRLGCTLFDARAGFAAAVMTAFSPYALVHDTALQDTVLVNMLLLLALATLVWHTPSRPRLFLGGTALALAVLASGRIGFVLPVAGIWAACCLPGTRRERCRYAALVLLPAVVLVGGWMVRNWRLVGVPVVNTQAGYALFVGNNPWTFSHFPAESIDLSTAEALTHLPEGQQQALARADDLDLSQNLAATAVAWIRAHPGEALRGAALKVWVVLAGQLSPARGTATQAGYLAVYATVRILALIAVWRLRHDWRRHALLWGVLLGFLATTAVYWAHTSHTSVIDPILFVYAGAALSGFARRFEPAPRTA